VWSKPRQLLGLAAAAIAVAIARAATAVAAAAAPLAAAAATAAAAAADRARSPHEASHRPTFAVPSWIESERASASCNGCLESERSASCESGAR